MEISRILDRGINDELVLSYGPHNVESALDAYGLLSLWTTWAEEAAHIVLREN